MRDGKGFAVMIAQCAIGICLVAWVMGMMGCSNWQGMEFKIGIGQYNGAQETKTFTKEKPGN